MTLCGEFLPQEAYSKAISLMQFADCLIIINKDKTRMEGKADLVFHDSIGKILTNLTE